MNLYELYHDCKETFLDLYINLPQSIKKEYCETCNKLTIFGKVIYTIFFFCLICIFTILLLIVAFIFISIETFSHIIKYIINKSKPVFFK